MRGAVSFSEIIKLPAPNLDWDFPLMKALAHRRSVRKFSPEDLPISTISDLLWSACGVSSPADKKSKCKRTAPSAGNSQAVKVFAALKSGLFVYEEEFHELRRVSNENIIASLTTRKRPLDAPVGLIYAADYSKMKMYLSSKSENRKLSASSTEAGHIAQNVYLFCAAKGLNTVMFGLVDREKLGELMKLRENEKVLYTQLIGLPPA